MPNILVGVTGGIAAYKTAELVSLLTKQGHDVRCIMTENAQQFITPLTLQTLSGNPVYTGMFELAKEPEWNVPHIGLATWADCVLIVPATANVIGKIANGIADDMLTTVVMATTAPVIFAPAMNSQMYLNPIVQDNIRKLKEYGYQFVEPIDGNLACGTSGVGKMESPAKIAQVLERLREQDYAGMKILVTAGPTMESIDPVRYVTNHSSGKMGYAIARQAANRGAKVILISGPSQQEIPGGVTCIPVRSAQDMLEAVQAHYESCDIIIKAAAVSDYRPATVATQKIKKSGENLHLELERTTDILKWLGSVKNNQILVGFAAETNDVETYARKKLEEKNLDYICANDVSRADSGFGQDNNLITIFERNGAVHALPMMTKVQAADKLLDIIRDGKTKKNASRD